MTGTEEAPGLSRPDRPEATRGAEMTRPLETTQWL
jgi:hypothetical protein